MTSVRAQRFLEAFSAAAHDLELEENGFTIYHFFDSDFLHRIIFGYRDHLNHELIRESQLFDEDSLASQRLLMGALVGQGIGAPPLMRALPPHLYEIRLAVERPWSRHAQNSRDLLMEKLRLHGLVRGLRDAVGTGKPDAVLERVIENGPMIFAGVELLSGSWESRLGRVLSLGVHEPSPFDDEGQVGIGEAFDLLVRYVGQDADDAQPAGGVSGVRDAMALAMLAAGVAGTADASKPCALARFYTETPRIHRAWRERDDMKAVLTYGARESGTPAPHHGMHGVLRTTYYYLIRALMPELGYSRSTDDRPENAQSSRMFEIGRELAEAAEALRRGGLSEKDLAELRVGSSTLGQFMSEITDLSSYGTAWRRLMGTVPQGLPAALVEDLTDVLEYKRSRARELDASFAKLVRSLADRTQHVAEFTDTYVRLLEILSQWGGALRPAFGGYAEHFGLPRWGFAADDCDEDGLRYLVDSYEQWLADRRASQRTSNARTRFVIELAHRLGDIRSAPMESSRRLTQEVALLGFLWLVGDYRSVQRYGRTLIEGIKLRLSGHVRPRESRGDAGEEIERLLRIAGALENMLAVAEIALTIAELRGTAEDGGDAANELAAEARAVADRLSAASREFPTSEAARAITQGYVLFQAWHACNPTVMLHGERQPARLRQPALVKESLEVCVEALAGCDHGGPMYVLLLNHCVYVSAVARLEERHPELARQLLVYPSEGHSWSYRLDDTLGYYFYARAAASVAEFEQRGLGEIDLLESARKDLREAERRLNRVPEHVHDTEVIGHRGLVRELEFQLGQMTRERVNVSA